ncbi:sigma-70 family RNA polymerase sigma factor [Algoriphagus sp. CAU 1675]|uniref:RNA polymerase sigma factor n=1 Tax=Algoriphagus sp. CAU 1675 TaxID=3032597 RepID=UPI0023DA3EF2|nr:sigma-70 family RNA polymerase sigma factor [Algoriphagus sp. CAU 1675]MDF2159276.1 sigma-70 family RNA polymerase sigma factor [Algoriphagus sp. CAU 1675]
MRLAKSFSDQELIEKISKKKDQNTAIRQLYQEHYGMLENYILQNSGSHEEAADLIQEVMLVFVKMVSDAKFRGESSIKSILYSICRNLWITELRKRKSTLNRQGIFHSNSEETDEDVTKAIAKQESLNYVMDLFDRLGEQCKQILKLFYYEELPMKEICQKLDFSSEQVLRNKKYKCLKTLNESVKSSPEIYKNLQKALRHE